MIPLRVVRIVAVLSLPAAVMGQSLGSAGTVTGSVLDPSDRAVSSASVEIRNALSGYRQVVTTGLDGTYRLSNVPPNPYHMTVQAPGFAASERDVQVRGSLPISLDVKLAVASATTSLTVHSAGADLLENVPYAHNDMDQAMFSKLPALSPGSGLSDAIILGSPGVVADSNGFFHPLGDHAQTTSS
ncbi:MAG: carboxypeptidase-like regulatory domain-containing protein [Bryobacteraceae bacterium]